MRKFILDPGQLIITALGVLVAALFAVAFTMHSHGVGQAVKPTASCAKPAATIQVSFAGGAISPISIDAHTCDQLVIHNQETSKVEVAVGPHSKPLNYPGLALLVIRPGQSQTVTLTAAGTFVLHNHFNDDQTAILTVTP